MLARFPLSTSRVAVSAFPAVGASWLDGVIAGLCSLLEDNMYLNRTLERSPFHLIL
jgi:hypothetical protein